MEPFDSINNWISEHGSSVVQAAHIDYLKTKLADAERLVESKDSEISDLKSERDDLKRALNSCQKDLEKLRAEIDKRNRKQQPPPDIKVNFGGGNIQSPM